jgi:two-component system response regulator FixJ
MLHAPFTNEANEASRDAEHIVYVIDDEPLLRRSSCYLIAALGLSCIQYESGPHFLSAIDDLQPGCILLDMVMTPMDGLGVQSELLARGIDWPIIFMSAAPRTRAIVAAMQQGAVEYLEKPFLDEDLLAALHRGFVKLRG